MKIRLDLIKKPQIQDIHRCFANRSERYWLGVLAIFVIVSRWLGHMGYLYSTDSVRYALALDKYDVSIHQPHPPGYALYILFTKPIYWLVGDANTALVIVSIIFSVLALYTAFYLAKRVYGSRVAWVSVLLFITAPLVWFHGQVASNYIADAFFAALFGIYAYDSLKSKKDSASLIKASIALAIGGGFRPTLVIFMLPLWLWVILRRRDFKVFLSNAGIILMVTLAWLIPSAWLSGGLKNFWEAIYCLIFDKSALYSFSAVLGGMEQMWIQFNMMLRNLLLNFGLAVVFIILWLISFAVPRMDNVKINLNNLLFWTLWILPPILFYILVIFTLSGYLLIIIPALTIMIAKAIDIIVNSVIKILPKLLIKKSLLPTALLSVVMIFIVAVNVYSYLSPSRISEVEFQKPSYFTISSINRLWTELIPAIEQEFNPQNTVIGINAQYVMWGLPHFQYYLPQYPTYSRIFWGRAHLEDEIWYAAYNGRVKFAKTLDILPTDARMIIVGGNWYFNKGSGFEEIMLNNNMGKILYYDLTDPTIRKLVGDINNLRMIGGEIESEQES